MKIFLGVTFVVLCTCSPAFADTLMNAWTNPASGNWEDPKWSLGIHPGPGQNIVLTNQGWKAIAIGPNTVQNFPEALDVNSVTLGGYTDSFNLLLLNFAGFEVPLTTGSINVGTNSGITALASVLSVSNNPGPGTLSIFSVFNQGEEAVVNAQAITLGDLANAAAGGGTYNQTNGTINADAISGWSGSSFNQFDGSNTVNGALSLGGADGSNAAQYRIYGGSLTAGSIELQRGSFSQSSGSVTARLDVGAATYNLSGGILHLPGITIPSAVYGPQNPGGFLGANAMLLQTGGTNVCDGPMTVYFEHGFAGVGVPLLGPGSYVLSNGVLSVSGTVRAWMSSFEQWGGWHTNAGVEVAGDVYPGWVIYSGGFTLGGGMLETPSINVSLGDFTQSGGTNLVSGDVNVGSAGSPATFTLSGGLLTDLNATIDASNPAKPSPQQALFTQTGGTHIITNRLRLSGVTLNLGGYHSDALIGYSLSDGVLYVPNVQIDSGAMFQHDGGTLTTSGLLNLAYATWVEKTSGQQFGQLLLSAPAGTNATLSLPAGKDCIVHFADSSSVTWSNQAVLVVQSWDGSPMGGGRHQLFFGSSASGLTPQQIGQIQFRNPAGKAGTLPARILSTGEIVPDRLLVARRFTNSLVIEWTGGSLQSSTNAAGPFENVTGATNPFTVPLTEPTRFFRVNGTE